MVKISVEQSSVTRLGFYLNISKHNEHRYIHHKMTFAFRFFEVPLRKDLAQNYMELLLDTFDSKLIDLVMKEIKALQTFERQESNF